MSVTLRSIKLGNFLRKDGGLIEIIVGNITKIYDVRILIIFEALPLPMLQTLQVIIAKN